MQPTDGQQVNSQNIGVSGRIEEVNRVMLEINGTAVPVERTDANNYSFSGEITLPAGMNTVVAAATDEAGHIGRDQKTVQVRIPREFSVSDLRFTQSGLFDSGSVLAAATRRVARKTSLFRLRVGIRTHDGLSTYVDNAVLVLEGGGPAEQFFPGQPRPPTGNNQFEQYPAKINPIEDGQQAYFFIDGRFLDTGYQYRFILKLYIRGRVVYEPLASDWSFQYIRGITMLLVPQHRNLDKGYIRALIGTLKETARMFPVPDGIANLDSDEIGGIRFASLPPVSYRDHMDPADPLPLAHPYADIPTPIGYEQGFLLHDHDILMNGATTPCPGEVLPINFGYPEDENRNGMFDAQETARLTPAGPTAASPIYQRFLNWVTFAREAAERLRVDWNRNHSRASRRAIVIVTSSGGNRADSTAQNRSGLEGQAANGCSSFWASVNIGGNDVIPHETGHTFGFASTTNRHTNGLPAGSPPATPVPPCEFPGEAINLLTRQIVNPNSAPALMCSWAGRASDRFLSTAEYNALFVRLVNMGGED